MSDVSLTRRQTLRTLSASLGAAVLPTTKPLAKSPFTLCLNLSTIRGQKLGFVKELEVASKAGFRSVEIWVETLDTYLKSGGTVAEARKRLNDLGLRIEGAIGFAPWIVDDAVQRAQALDQLRREMDMLASVDCRRIACPPAGATNTPGLDLAKAGERYRAILELGDKTGVVPQLELWGFSKNLSRLSEVLYVAAESGHPSARLLLDVYHLYKGGTAPAALDLVSHSAMEVFHINDYPANPPRETIGDADRIYPGDGIAPLADVLKRVKNPNRPLVLSLELFNKTYFAQDALMVAKTGLAKVKAVVAGV